MPGMYADYVMIMTRHMHCVAGSMNSTEAPHGHVSHVLDLLVRAAWYSSTQWPVFVGR